MTTLRKIGQPAKKAMFPRNESEAADLLDAYLAGCGAVRRRRRGARTIDVCHLARLLGTVWGRRIATDEP